MFKDLEYPIDIMKTSFPTLFDLYEVRKSHEDIKNFLYEVISSYKSDGMVDINKLFEDLDFDITNEYRNLLYAYENHILRKKCDTCGNFKDNLCKLKSCPDMLEISDLAVELIDSDFKDLRIESNNFIDCFLAALYDFCIRNKDTEAILYSDNYDEYIKFYINRIMGVGVYSNNFEDMKLILNSKSMSFLFAPKSGAFKSGSTIYITDLEKLKR